MMDYEILIPDIEVLVGAGGNEVALFCFYQRKDIHQGYDIVCGISHQDAKSVIRQILQDAIRSLEAEGWYDVDGLREALDPGVDGQEP